MTERKRGQINVKVGTDGAVQLTFVAEGKDAVFELAPEEASALLSHILVAANSAFLTTDKDDAMIATKFQGALALPVSVPVSSWHMGNKNVQGQRAVVVRVGEVAIGYIVQEIQLRELGRQFLSASWKFKSSLHLLPLLRSLLRDFSEDLLSWGRVLKSRFNDSSLRLARSFWLWISGRSLRLFRVVKIAPDADLPDYQAVGECIYCGARAYSEKPDVRRHPLGAEHIIADGLGGKLELPQASCQKCEDITGGIVERDILLRTLKALRMHLKIRGKRGSSKPATLPLTKTDDGRDEVIQMPVDDYPVIFSMPAMGVPGIFIGAPGGDQRAYGFRLVILNYDERKLRKTYGIHSFASPHWDTHMLYRMIAKIGHAFAVAELGRNNFKPLLLDMILNGTPEAFNHIGGEPDLERHPASEALHELGLGYQRANGKEYVVARVRLFAKQHGPIYYVVVGESLERPFARFSRSFGRGIYLRLCDER
jgi:hypothetical protein